MRKIIIDTSSILFAMSQKKEIFEMVRESYPEYEPVISRGVVKELQKLAATRKKNAKDAAAALAALGNRHITTLPNSSYVDEWIISESSKNGSAVCSNDAELRRRLRLLGIKVVAVVVGGRFR